MANEEKTAKRRRAPRGTCCCCQEPQEPKNSLPQHWCIVGGLEG